MGVVGGMSCLFPALGMCWNSVSFSAGVAVAGSPWMADTGPLAPASRHFHSLFFLKKENTSAVTYHTAAGPEVCVDSISGTQE